MDIYKLIAKEIDPMAWKAWEVDGAIEDRRKVSLAKARSALIAIRTLPPERAAHAADRIKKSDTDGTVGAVALTGQAVTAIWAAVIDSIVEADPKAI